MAEDDAQSRSIRERFARAANGKPVPVAAGFSRRRTRRKNATWERRRMCLVSRCSGLNIPYFLRPADRKTGGGWPVRPPDRKIRQKRLIGRER